MASDDAGTRSVGPYLLQKTLGKGQTGLVKLGVHCTSGRTVAVKIINREKLSKSVLMKVEREIAIMKLINHPHVLGLHDVYENNVHLYLVLEHVSGGELFDYLVKKGRLAEKEARRFFKQIVSAVDFCHKHSICHRDLKPENLLLDDKKNIKVADFGMASLQMTGKLLETSCGSPHYACPEVIRGENYDGRKADVWSLGVILFALLVGSLPFDDDNLRTLLEKVKRGRFSIPHYVPAGAQELIRGMVDVNPKTRITLDQVMSSPWFRASSFEGAYEPVLPMKDMVKTCPIARMEDIDPDVFSSMASLGCYRDKSKLAEALLAPEHNEEKIIYYLLLERKEKNPSLEDDSRLLSTREKDPPRKRVDSQAAIPPSFQLQRARSHSIGSANLDTTPPRSPRISTTTPPASYTPTGYYYYSPQPPQKTHSGGRKTSVASHECASTLPLGSSLEAPPSPSGATPWKRRLSTTLKTMVSSPKFGRRQFVGTQGGGSGEGSPRGGHSPETVLPSPQSAKRSWFANFKSEKEKQEVVVVYRDKRLQDLHDSLISALNVVNVQHEKLNESLYKCKYERSQHAEMKGKTVLQKKVKFTVSVVAVQSSRGSTVSADAAVSLYDGKTYSLNFQLTSGPSRRFQRVCDKIQAVIADPRAVNMLTKDCIDYEHPSGSSDDTLTRHSTNGVAIGRNKDSTSSVDIVIHSPHTGRPSILSGHSSESEDDLLD